MSPRPFFLLAVLIVSGCGPPPERSPVEEMFERMQSGRTGLMYHDNLAFELTAPNGWVIDNAAGKAQGLQAVFYRKGESWDDFTVGMYIRMKGPDKDGLVDHRSVMRSDSLYFVGVDPPLIITSSEPIVTAGGLESAVRCFDGGPYDQHEFVAYIPDPRLTVMVVAISDSRERLEKARSAFEDLVKSYRFVTTSFHIIDDRPPPR